MGSSRVQGRQRVELRSRLHDERLSLDVLTCSFFLLILLSRVRDRERKYHKRLMRGSKLKSGRKQKANTSITMR